MNVYLPFSLIVCQWRGMSMFPSQLPFYFYGKMKRKEWGNKSCKSGTHKESSSLTEERHLFYSWVNDELRDNNIRSFMLSLGMTTVFAFLCICFLSLIELGFDWLCFWSSFLQSRYDDLMTTDTRVNGYCFVKHSCNTYQGRTTQLKGRNNAEQCVARVLRVLVEILLAAYF